MQASAPSLTPVLRLLSSPTLWVHSSPAVAHEGDPLTNGSLQLVSSSFLLLCKFEPLIWWHHMQSSLRILLLRRSCRSHPASSTQSYLFRISRRSLGWWWFGQVTDGRLELDHPSLQCCFGGEGEDWLLLQIFSSRLCCKSQDFGESWKNVSHE